MIKQDDELDCALLQIYSALKRCESPRHVKTYALAKVLNRHLEKVFVEDHHQEELYYLSHTVTKFLADNSNDSFMPLRALALAFHSYAKAYYEHNNECDNCQRESEK